jgi:hypothetical protein
MTTPDNVEEILAHVGVKGMKWGVRKSSTSSSFPSRSERRQAKRINKMDARFERNITSKHQNKALKGRIHNEIIPVANSKVHRINAKPEYVKEFAKGKTGRLNDPNDPLTKKYIKEVNSAYLGVMNDYLKGFSNASGTKKLRASYQQGDYLNFKLTLIDTTKTKHADDSLTMTIEYIRDESGRITGFKIIDDEMTQSSIFVDEFLEHVGVKGMKWGVRKDHAVDTFVSRGLGISTTGNRERAAARTTKGHTTSSKKKSPHPVTVKEHGKKLKTSGGKGHPAHPDAVRARTLGQVGKKSGLKALSDHELQTYAHRLQLEQNVKRLNYNELSTSRRFVATLLGRQGSQMLGDAAKTGTAKAGRSALNSATRKSIRVARVAARA